MKIIESYGGPFILFDSKASSEWGGVEGKIFSRDAPQYSCDYELACVQGEQSSLYFDGKEATVFASENSGLFIIKHDKESLIIRLNSCDVDDEEFCKNFDFTSFFDKSFPTTATWFFFHSNQFHLFDSALTCSRAKEENKLIEQQCSLGWARFGSFHIEGSEKFGEFSFFGTIIRPVERPFDFSSTVF